jgi:hypothetical protein
MRAKELLIKGSTMLIPVRGITFDGFGGGCALGMMGVAHGGAAGTDISCFSEFSWLSYRITRSPCGCPASSGEGCVASIVAHIFDDHVFGDQTWTIPQLADWLDTVDPTPVEVTDTVVIGNQIEEEKEEMCCSQ